MKVPKTWSTEPAVLPQTKNEEKSKTTREQTPKVLRHQTPKSPRHQTPKSPRHQTPKVARQQTPKSPKLQTPKFLRHQIATFEDEDDEDDTYYVTLLRKLETEVLEKKEDKEEEDSNEEQTKSKCSCKKVLHSILVFFILLTFLLLAFAMLTAGFLLELEEPAGFPPNSPSSKCRGTWASIWLIIGGFSIIFCHLFVYFLFVKPLQCSKLLSIFLIHLFTLSWWVVGCVWFAEYDSSCRTSTVGIFLGCALLIPLAAILLFLVPCTIKTSCWLGRMSGCRKQQEQGDENWEWISEATTSEKIV